MTRAAIVASPPQALWGRDGAVEASFASRGCTTYADRRESDQRQETHVSPSWCGDWREGRWGPGISREGGLAGRPPHRGGLAGGFTGGRRLTGRPSPQTSEKNNVGVVVYTGAPSSRPHISNDERRSHDMSQPLNPYTPPAQHRGGAIVAPGQPMANAQFWREGEQLVTNRTSGTVTLPDHCVRCGQRAVQRLDKSFQWHPRWLGFVVIASPIIYLILAMFLRKKVQIDFGLCDEHAKKRSTAIIIAVGGSLLSLAVLIGGAVGDAWPVSLIGTLGFLAAIVTSAMMMRTLQPTKMDDNYAWFKAEQPFLNHIGAPGGYGVPGQGGVGT